MHSQQLLDRRQWLQRSAILGAGSGLGGTALASLLANQSTPHFAARAKHVIYIHMVGAPSTLDLFDLKPELQRRQGQKCPDEFFKGKKLAFIRSHPKLLGTATDRRYALISNGWINRTAYLLLCYHVTASVAVASLPHGDVAPTR